MLDVLVKEAGQVSSVPFGTLQDKSNEELKEIFRALVTVCLSSRSHACCASLVRSKQVTCPEVVELLVEKLAKDVVASKAYEEQTKELGLNKFNEMVMHIQPTLSLRGMRSRNWPKDCLCGPCCDILFEALTKLRGWIFRSLAPCCASKLVSCTLPGALE